MGREQRAKPSDQLVARVPGDYSQFAEAQQALFQQLVAAEEAVRARIARDLHDQTGQQLTALSLGLTMLKASSYGRASTLQTLEQLQRIIDELGSELQAIAFQLRPMALDDLGLSAALASLITDWTQRTQIAAEFHSSGLDAIRLAAAVETTIYRVVQEALTNVLRHAQARQVSVIVGQRDGDVIAIVEDDGQGFDVEAVLCQPYRQQRLGIRGMQERLALVGGALAIESAARGGTTIFIRIPLQNSKVQSEYEQTTSFSG